MTAASRARKSQRKRSLWAGTLLLAALAFGCPVASDAATTEQIVTDPHTGLAIYGVDPVAYFTDQKVRLGRDEFEYRFAGVIWRFANEGNRAAFVANPEVYMPGFGGYDPIGIGRGVTTPGFPQLWTVVENRLYLFYTAAARYAFLADPARAIAAAQARWAAVSKDLVQ